MKYSDSNKLLYGMTIWEMDNAGRQAEGCARAPKYYVERGSAGCGVLRGARRRFYFRQIVGHVPQSSTRGTE